MLSAEFLCSLGCCFLVIFTVSDLILIVAGGVFDEISLAQYIISKTIFCYYLMMGCFQSKTTTQYTPGYEEPTVLAAETPCEYASFTKSWSFVLFKLKLQFACFIAVKFDYLFS